MGSTQSEGPAAPGWDQAQWAADLAALMARIGRRAPRSALRELGLPEGAGLADVRSAFRALALVHHPDHGGDAEVFRRIRAAHDAAVAALSHS